MRKNNDLKTNEEEEKKTVIFFSCQCYYLQHLVLLIAFFVFRFSVWLSTSINKLKKKQPSWAYFCLKSRWIYKSVNDKLNISTIIISKTRGRSQGMMMRKIYFLDEWKTCLSPVDKVSAPDAFYQKFERWVFIRCTSERLHGNSFIKFFNKKKVPT